MNALNTFNNGLVLDTHPLSTPNTVLTNCLNGTLITKNGNEMILQNDVGNSKIYFNNEVVTLTPGFIPVGLKEFGGILYIFSVNPNEIDTDGRYLSEIGSFPSPKYPDSEGKLEYNYKPLHNYRKNDLFIDFRTYNLNFDVEHPLTIDCRLSYDDSIDLYFTDNKNKPRLINTRFSIHGDNNYTIVDRKTKEFEDSDTNIYSDEDFELLTTLNKWVDRIVKIKFDGVSTGGNLLVGNYTFYFTLADLDSNESDFIGLSGMVTCHKGNLNDPFSIDGGIADENSYKAVLFTLTNLPKNYDKVWVYYSRNTCDENGIIITTYKKIVNDYEIEDGKCSIIITGFEQLLDSNLERLNLNYVLFERTKSQAIVSNIMLQANVSNSKYQLYEDLEEEALNIKGIWVLEGSVIGKLSGQYIDNSDSDNKNEYYNTQNIYYRVGYWPNEFYRFGIVYILDDYSTTPVFNITGHIGTKENKYGIFLVDDMDVLSESKPIGILFTKPQIDNLELKEKVKGYFFVRQKRIKTILALGIRIGYDKEYSNLPLLYGTLNSNSYTGDNVYTVSVNVLKIPTEESTEYVVSGDFDMPWSKNVPEDIILNTKLRYFGNMDLAEFHIKFTKTFYNINNVKDYLKYSLNFTDSNLNILDTEDKNENFDVDIEYDISGKNTDVNLEQITDWFTLGILSPYFGNRRIAQLVTKYDTPVYRFNIDDLDGLRNLPKESLTELTNTLLFRDFARENFEKVRTKGNDNGKTNAQIDKCVKPTCDALLCPEFEINLDYYGSMFTGTKFNYKNSYSQTISSEEYLLHVFSDKITKSLDNTIHDNTYIIAVSEGLEAIKNKKNFYSSIAGNEYLAEKYKLPFTKFHTYYDALDKRDEIDGLKPEGDLIFLSGITRGIWGPYLGIEEYDDNNLKHTTKDDVYKIIDILIPNYNDTISNALSVRQNDKSEYYPISDRFNINEQLNPIYRGDCFICNFTHRMNRNFMDPEFPITDEIADIKTLGKGFRAKMNQEYATAVEKGDADTKLAVISKNRTGLLLDSIKYLNRADINAVRLGHWITVKVLSSTNLSMRSTDSSNIVEKTKTGNARSFYPLRKFDTSSNNKISDSYILSEAYSKTLGEKFNILKVDTPAEKAVNLSTRIYYSYGLNPTYLFNNLRVFKDINFLDYTKQYGSIVKLLNYNEKLIVIFEHAIMALAVNEKALVGQTYSQQVFAKTGDVLSDTPTPYSTEFGSLWPDSVVTTATGIYGIDTVAKKIWCVDTLFKAISDFTVGKFIKDNLLITELETLPNLTKLNVKTHYNKHKGDIMFTFFKLKDDDYIGWNICYNEITKKFTTFYSWIPSYSGNINNTFYSFDNDYSINNLKNIKQNFLWEHNKENNWCNWYDELHPFEFEFVIADNPQLHKTLDNLLIIANKTKPESFHFEIIGECYNFANDKKNMYYRLERTKLLYLNANISYDKDYKSIDINLNKMSTIFPLYISRVDNKNKIYDTYLRLTSNSRDYQDMSGSEIVKDDVINEYCIITHIKAYPIDGYEWVKLCGSDETNQINRLRQYYNSKGIETNIVGEYFCKKVNYGRRLGNCEYKEDLWKIQVPSINFYQINERPWNTEPPICLMTNPVPEELEEIQSELTVPNDTIYSYNTNVKQTRIKDKYIKIKIRYSGEDLAIISTVMSIYTESYS